MSPVRYGGMEITIRKDRGDHDPVHIAYADRRITSAGDSVLADYRHSFNRGFLKFRSLNRIPGFPVWREKEDSVFCYRIGAGRSDHRIHEAASLRRCQSFRTGRGHIRKDLSTVHDHQCLVSVRTENTAVRIKTQIIIHIFPDAHLPCLEFNDPGINDLPH